MGGGRTGAPQEQHREGQGRTHRRAEPQGSQFPCGWRKDGGDPAASDSFKQKASSSGGCSGKYGASCIRKTTDSIHTWGKMMLDHGSVRNTLRHAPLGGESPSHSGDVGRFVGKVFS